MLRAPQKHPVMYTPKPIQPLYVPNSLGAEKPGPGVPYRPCIAQALHSLDLHSLDSMHFGFQTLYKPGTLSKLDQDLGGPIISVHPIPRTWGILQKCCICWPWDLGCLVPCTSQIRTWDTLYRPCTSWSSTRDTLYPLYRPVPRLGAPHNPCSPWTRHLCYPTDCI